MTQQSAQEVRRRLFDEVRKYGVNHDAGTQATSEAADRILALIREAVEQRRVDPDDDILKLLGGEA